MNIIERCSARFKNELLLSCISKPLLTNMINSSFSTDLSSYELGGVIGKSSFLSSVIYVGKYLKTNELVAIKRYNLEEMSVDDMKLLQRELWVVNELEHANILAETTSFVAQNEIIMVCPLMGYRSCADLITKHFHTGLPEDVIQIILTDVLNALIFIHKKGIIHRAVKASHILVSRDGCIKLTGFRHVYQRDVICEKQKGFDFPPKSVANLKWLSPDVLRQNRVGYDEKSDIYSLGITICELCNGFVPYFDMKLTAMLVQKMNGNIPHIYDASTIKKLHDTPDQELVNIFYNYFSTRLINKYLHEFKDLCCIDNPKERPSADTLILHSLFTKVDKKRKLFCELIQPAVPITEKSFSDSNYSEVCKTNDNELDMNVFNWEF